ncbi:isochorismatase family protein [Lactococcus nasutitermitis]|uniref:Isochorismatase family protein n=1 Tax=Lactococcus nasutitermitis TaxID=1652957 RepID=A0ABV9JEB7_9LACT|nr:isochorismatase family protein [Lactococcus nasutitermitis]
MTETLDLTKTALVIIDLQKGIVARDNFAPYSAQEVLEKNEQLLQKLVNTEALIVFVHVKNYGEEALRPLTDAVQNRTGKLPEDFSDFVSPIAFDKTVKNIIHVEKHNWGAFYGTDLDVQLRRRGIENVVLTGIATTIGVDTTAREAYQHSYNVLTVEDAMTDFDGEFHNETVKHIFKRLGRVRTTAEVLEMFN